MKATLELYEPLHEHLRTVSKNGQVSCVKYVIKIGPIVIIKSSERTAHRYLHKMGFRLNDKAQYELKMKSHDELNLETNYQKL